MKHICKVFLAKRIRLISLMKTTINQKEYDFEVSPNAAAVDLIRDKAHLTGTKFVCGSGVCGACTILVEGNPVCSCLLPASRLEGKSVLTIEGHESADGELHPVQKAMMAHDGLQCGYCTSGFINAGIAFFETWRKANGKTKPTRDTIGAALAGNLCRCGAYQGIYAALQTACAGDFDTMATADVPRHRVEAPEKVTGRAKYTTDQVIDGMIYGKVLRAIYPHAKVKSIDTSAAEALDGVFAVLDVLRDKERTVRFVGTPIAAVAAVDAKTAEKAADLIKVDYEVYPAVTSFEASRAATNATAEQSFRKHVSGGLPVPSKWDGNTRSYRLSLTSNKGFRAARTVKRARASNDDHLIDVKMQAGGQAHTPLEPHGALAGWDNGHLTLYVSTQAVTQVRDKIAKKYQLAHDQITLICDHVGGGFGSKGGDYPEIYIAIDLAKKAGKAVRLILDRHEVIAYSGHREETQFEMGLLSNKEADFRAMQLDVWNNGGHSIEGNAAAVAATYYPSFPQLVNDHSVITHQPPAHPFRGPGGINGAFALESTVDDMAYKIGIDPLELRRKWDTHKQDQQLFDYLEEVPAWQARDRVKADLGRYKRGVGLSMGHWLHLYMPKAQVRVTAGRHGISVETGIQDIGQGSRTLLGTALAEVFGMNVGDPLITIKTGRPSDVNSPATGGSRVTTSVYAPAQDAARQVQAQIVADLSQQMGLTGAAYGPEGISHSAGKISWPDALKQIKQDKIEVVATRGRDTKGVGLTGMIDLDGTGLNMGFGPSTSAQITEVEVDTRLGKIRVLRTWSAIAAGRIFLEEAAKSQVFGGITMGIGYTLYEDRQIDGKTGQVITDTLEDCRLPGIGDMPEMEVVFMPEGFEHVMGGGVGIGEVTMVPVAASIANAVYHATGWRPTSVPIRPSDVIEGVRG
ncbi:MAG: xanthine dehydrogenase YagR molybdenum-binding subunit [Cellvibrionaceae bacterium]